MIATRFSPKYCTYLCLTALLAASLSYVSPGSAFATDEARFRLNTANSQFSHTQIPVSATRTAHGSIEEFNLRGDHFSALGALEALDRAPTLAEQLAAAKSAWALGLTERARFLWDDAFANRDFVGLPRQRAELARAILELQEGEYEQARSFAERGAAELGPSDLRAQLWLVVGEALRAQGALSLAEGYYKRASQEGSRSVADEARFLLGETQFALGRVNESRYTFAGLDTRSRFTPRALRRLAQIDLMQRNYRGVLTWIQEGRDSYPSEFQDGWSSYALVSSYLSLGRAKEARRELADTKTLHSGDSSWVTLARAAYEAHMAKEIHGIASMDEASVSELGDKPAKSTPSSAKDRESRRSR